MGVQAAPQKKETRQFLILTILILYFIINFHSAAGQEADDDRNENESLETRMTKKMMAMESRLKNQIKLLETLFQNTEQRLNVSISALEKSPQHQGSTNTILRKGPEPGNRNGHAPIAQNVGFKPSKKTDAISVILAEIKSKMNSLSAAGANSNDTLIHVNAVKRTLQLELRILRNRLDDLKREIQTENLATTTILMEQVQNVTNYLAQVQADERKKIRQELVQNITSFFLSNDLVTASDQVRLFLPDEVDLAVPEFIKRIYDQDVSKLDKILQFSQTLPPSSFLSAVRTIVEIMVVKGQVDTPQFLQLGLFAKNTFGNRLRHKFPSAVKDFVFSQTACIRNLYTNRFLVLQEDGKMEGGMHLVQARRGSVGNGTLAQFCGWTVYPVYSTSSSSVLSNSSSFVIRTDSTDHGTMEEPQYLNFLNGLIFAGLGQDSQNFIWNIYTRRNGEALTIQQSDRRDNKGSIKFLCVSSGSANVENKGTSRSVEMISNYGRSCDWYIYNDYEA